MKTLLCDRATARLVAAAFRVMPLERGALAAELHVSSDRLRTYELGPRTMPLVTAIAFAGVLRDQAHHSPYPPRARELSAQLEKALLGQAERHFAALFADAMRRGVSADDFADEVMAQFTEIIGPDAAAAMQAALAEVSHSAAKPTLMLH